MESSLFSFCFILLSCIVLSQGASDMGRWVVSIEAGSGNVPMYNIYTLYGPASHYRVFFNSIVELSGDQKNGQAQVALPSLDWEWTQPSLIDNTYVFDIKGSTSEPNIQFSSIEFYHSISVNDENIDIKFDVVIEDYTWVTPSSVSDRSIEIAYSVQDEKGGNAQVSGNETNVEYNDLYLRIGPNDTQATVTDSQGTHAVDVRLITKGNGKSISLIYSGFPTEDSFESLVHDPHLGVTAGSTQLAVTWMVMVFCFVTLFQNPYNFVE